MICHGALGIRHPVQLNADTLRPLINLLSISPCNRLQIAILYSLSYLLRHPLHMGYQEKYPLYSRHNRHLPRLASYTVSGITRSQFSIHNKFSFTKIVKIAPIRSVFAVNQNAFSRSPRGQLTALPKTPYRLQESATPWHQSISSALL